MRLLDILSTPNRVDALRADRRAALDAAFTDLTRWLTTQATELPLHHVTAALFQRVTALALTALTLWSALRLNPFVPKLLVEGSVSYTFEAWRLEPVRTRFGVFHSLEPLYVRHQGKGPKRLLPHARRMGLAAGRMCLGVHLLVAELMARMPSAAAGEVAKAVGLWVPGPRARLGIVDILGQEAIAAMQSPVAPNAEDEGTHVVIEQDDGGIPHVRPDELEKRRKPNRRPTRARGRRSPLEKRRERRGLRVDRNRRAIGDKSKNCRMATIYVVYTLRVHTDGTVEGPLNRQVFGRTRDKAALQKTVLDAARARGWGTKPSIYLADGAASHWKAWRQVFCEGTPCIDWYHVSEYLWAAADAVHGAAPPAPKGKRARELYKREKFRLAKERSTWVRARQDELLDGKVDAVLEAVRALEARIGRTGPGTRSRREKIGSTLTYLNNHRDFLTYATVGAIVMGTGVVEGTIKQLGVRMKGAGMRWSVERAERVLALRCLQLSTREAWTGFVAGVEKAHEAITSLHVLAISPTEALTPYKAVKKAA